MPGARRVVVGVGRPARRGQPVEAAAQRQHDQHVAGVRRSPANASRVDAVSPTRPPTTPSAGRRAGRAEQRAAGSARRLLVRGTRRPSTPSSDRWSSDGRRGAVEQQREQVGQPPAERLVAVGERRRRRLRRGRCRSRRGPRRSARGSRARRPRRRPARRGCAAGRAAAGTASGGGAGRSATSRRPGRDGRSSGPACRRRSPRGRVVGVAVRRVPAERRLPEVARASSTGCRTPSVPRRRRPDAEGADGRDHVLERPLDLVAGRGRNSWERNSSRSTGTIACRAPGRPSRGAVTSAAGGASETNRTASLRAMRWAVAGWWPGSAGSATATFSPYVERLGSEKPSTCTGPVECLDVS